MSSVAADWYMLARACLRRVRAMRESLPANATPRRRAEVEVRIARVLAAACDARDRARRARGG